MRPILNFLTQSNLNEYCYESYQLHSFYVICKRSKWVFHLWTCHFGAVWKSGLNTCMSAALVLSYYSKPFERLQAVRWTHLLCVLCVFVSESVCVCTRLMRSNPTHSWRRQWMQNKLACRDAALKPNTSSFTGKYSLSNTIFSLSNAIYIILYVNLQIIKLAWWIKYSYSTIVK